MARSADKSSRDPEPSAPSWPGYLPYLLVLAYMATVGLFAVNRPHLDDYDSTLPFALRYVHASWPDRLLAAFEAHNEHRIAFNHLLEALEIALLGRLDFKHLIFTGTFAWLMLIHALWKWAQAKGISAREFAPVPVLLCSFAHWELMNWAMGGNQQYFQLLFCVASIFAASTDRFWTATNLLVLAIFTGAGGFALAPCLVVYWLWTRQPVKALLTLLATGSTAYIYFKVLPPITATHTENIALLLHQPQALAAYIVCFLGSAFRLTRIAIPAGILLLWAIWKRRAALHQHRALALIVMFIIATAATAAIGRLHLGIDQARSSRYSEYSLLLMSALYLAFLLESGEPLRREKIRKIGLRFALLLFLYWIAPGWNALERQRDQLDTDEIVTDVPIETVRPQLREADRLGLFDNRPWPSTFGRPRP